VSGLRSILADPLYRWEVRRYWTWRCWVLTCFLLAACWLLIAYLALAVAEMLDVYREEPGGVFGSRFMLGSLLFLPLILRLPLGLMAVFGGALSVVTDKGSGALENFILTSVEPWRFGRALLWGRLTGLLLIWIAIGLPFCLGWPLLFPLLDKLGASRPWLTLLVAVVLQVDLGLMLLAGAATGLRYSITSSKLAGALGSASLVSTVLMPVVAWTGAGLLAGATGGLGKSLFGAAPLESMPGVNFYVVLVVWHCVLALLIAGAAFREARSAVDLLFLGSETGA
jgi:hypothetical protein